MDTLALSRALQAWHHSYSAVHGPLTEDQADVFRTLGEFLLATTECGNPTPLTERSFWNFQALRFRNDELT